MVGKFLESISLVWELHVSVTLMGNYYMPDKALKWIIVPGLSEIKMYKCVQCNMMLWEVWTMGLGPDFLAEIWKVESGGEIWCEGRVRVLSGRKMYKEG